METQSEKTRTKRDKSKQKEPITCVALIGLVFVMILAVVIRLGRPGMQGSCYFDSTVLKATCKGKDLFFIPLDIPDSAKILHMGDTLDQGENHLTVLIRSNFTRFKNLRDLALVRCDVENILKEPFADLLELRRLDLRFNRIRMLSESSFAGLTELDQLLLSNNPIQTLSDNTFRGLKIHHLEFANNPVLEKISSRAFYDSSITSLVFNRCNFKSLKPETWLILAPYLRRLQISDNLQPLDIKEETFKGFHMERLVLSNDGIAATAFLKHGDYEELILDGNPLSSLKFCIVDRKKQSKVTKVLSVSGAKITKITKETFSLLRNLEVLNLSSNNIDILDVEAFEDLDKLTTLDLSNNKIMEFVGNFFTIFQNLKVLFLDGNLLETIPSFVESFLSRLTNVSLSGNNFHCNCEFRWLLRWLIQRSGKHLSPPMETLSCRTPEIRNFSQLSEFDLKCRVPTILNATIDADGMTLVCTADGDPAPTVTWIGPYGEESRTDPSTATRTLFQVNGRMTIVRDGNYTCTAQNVVGMDSVVIDTNNIPLNGVKFFGESQQQKLHILESPQGFLIAAALVGLLGYILRHQ